MIIGHERQINYLEKIARSGEIPHAFIFAGPDHLGKRLIALVFFYLCSRQDAKPAEFFGENRLARAFTEGTHPDLFFLSREPDKKEIGIDQIRELKKFVALSPFELERKFVLIDNAHEVSTEAANSILKTLEEPSGQTTIILVTSRPSSLLLTIASRAVRLNFYPLSEELLAGGLKKEIGAIGEDELGWIAGRPGLAIRYLRNGRDSVILKRRESFKSFTQALTVMSIHKKMSLAEQVAADGDILNILESWLLSARSDLFKKESMAHLNLMERLKQCRELLLKTNANARLQLQDLLLSIGSV